MRLLLLLCLLLASADASARVLIVRAKQAQLDEAVAGVKAEVGDVVEVVVDEGASAALVQAKAAEAGADVVIAVGARAAQLSVGVDKPVVACMLLQASAAPTAGNVVKVPVSVPALAQLEALRALVPATKAVGVLYDPKHNAAEVEEIKAAAAFLKLKLVTKAVSDQKDTPAALDALLPQVDSLLLPADNTVISKAFLQYLVKRAFDNKLAVMTYSEAFVRLGLLAALVPSYVDNGRIAGRIAKKLVAGSTPAEQQSAAVMKGALVVNKRAGEKMGLTLAPRMLAAPTVVVGE